MKARLILVHALSPLHAGTGQGAGVIDLPVARERATGLPYLPGASLKGVLRDACRDPELRRRVFGPDSDRAHEHAGSVQIADQRLLLLPVRSVVGTFAWVTSPFVLRRFLRDVEAADIPGVPSDVPYPGSGGCCLVSGEDCAVVLGSGHVVFEDLKLTARGDEVVGRWARWIGKELFPNDEPWQKTLTARFCVVHDDVLSFLLDTATEVTARIRLREDAKTVEQGGLWYEEALPAETVLSGLVVAAPVKAEPAEVFETIAGLVAKPLQIGGKSTTGRGLCRLKVIGGERS